MSPLVRGGSYGHRARLALYLSYTTGAQNYVISWRVDRKIGRLRAISTYSRETDRAGAERFARKWKIKIDGES